MVSRKKRECTVEQFNYTSTECIVKLKNDILGNYEARGITNYQSFAFIKLLNSETIAVLLKEFLSQKEVENLIDIISRYSSSLMRENSQNHKRFHSFKLFEHIPQSLVAIRNIVTFYKEIISPMDLQKINNQLSTLLRNTSEIIVKRYVPLDSLFSIYNHAARISEETGIKCTQLSQKNALNDVLQSA